MLCKNNTVVWKKETLLGETEGHERVTVHTHGNAGPGSLPVARGCDTHAVFAGLSVLHTYAVVRVDFRFSQALQEMQEWKGRAKGQWGPSNEMGRGRQNALGIQAMGKGINIEW